MQDEIYKDLKNEMSFLKTQMSDLYKLIENMVISKAHLENETQVFKPSNPISMEEGMASKFNKKVQIGTDQNGTPIYKVIHASTQKELNEKIAEALNAAAKPISPLWEDYAQKWFTLYHLTKIREKTADGDRDLFNKHVLPTFAGKRIDEISIDDVQAVNLQKAELYSKSYLTEILCQWKQIFDAAIEDRYITFNPVKSKRVTKGLGKPKKERKPLTVPQQIALRNEIYLLGAIDKCFMALILDTGMRPEEVYGLTWENIDFERRILFIDKCVTFSKGKGILGEPKTEESKRIVPLSQFVIENLKPYKSTGYVVCRTSKGHEGEFYTEQAYKRQLQRIRKALPSLPKDFTPYCGRHTATSNAVRAGVPLPDVQKLLGHTDSRMIEKFYYSTDADRLVQNIDTMAEYLQNAVSKATAM